MAIAKAAGYLARAIAYSCELSRYEIARSTSNRSKIALASD
jgi:hypothetical protein